MNKLTQKMGRIWQSGESQSNSRSKKGEITMNKLTQRIGRSLRASRGLLAFVVLGLVGFLILLSSSGVWATPGQSPLRQSTPPPNTIDGFLCNNNDGVPGCQIPPPRLREGVAFSGSADTPIVNEPVKLDGGAQTDYTDANGYYAFGGLAAGSTHVVEAMGIKWTVTIGPGGEGVGQDFYPGMPQLFKIRLIPIMKNWPSSP